MAKAETGSRRQKGKEQTRRLIFDAAYRLFEANGYRKTTMRAIAKQAGVGLGTIFQHFPDKAFLLVEVFDTDLREVVMAALETLPATDIRKQLMHVSTHLYECYAKRPRLSLQIISETFQTEGASAARLKGQVDEFLAGVENLFKDAQGRGEIPQDMDCRDAAMAFWSFYLTCLHTGLWSMEDNLGPQLEQLDRLVCQHLKIYGR